MPRILSRDTSVWLEDLFLAPLPSMTGLPVSPSSSRPPHTAPLLPSGGAGHEHEEEKEDTLAEGILHDVVKPVDACSVDEYVAPLAPPPASHPPRSPTPAPCADDGGDWGSIDAEIRSDATSGIGWMRT